MVLAATATIAPRWAAAQLLPTPQIPATDPTVGSTPQDAAEVLQTPDISQDARDQAAVRMIAWRDPVVRPAVEQLLSTGSPAVKLALSRALASVGWPDAGFIQPLMSELLGRDAVSAGAAAMALSQYQDNPQVVAQLIIQARSPRVDVRQPVIRALGTFTSKAAAQTLLYLLQHDDNDVVRKEAGDALIAMTGRRDLDHDPTLWGQWWDKNGSLADNQFRDAIIYGRGQMFENALSQRRTLENAADDFLRADFWTAAPEKRAGILLSYLQSPAPEIRTLGAELVYSSATATGAPRGSIEQTRLLLADPSPEVRAAAAAALSADFDSAGDLEKQLAREPDDLVRVQLIKSLAPFQDGPAIEQMLKWMGSNASNSVRIAAAEGIREGSETVNKDPALKARAIDALEAGLKGTDVPGEDTVRTAIVGALASIRDDSLSDLLRQLLSDQDEPVGVRANALIGLGNLPNSAPFATEIARHLDDVPQMRLAALQAMRQPPSPLPISYINTLLKLMNEDPSDQMRLAVWDELQHWASLPAMDENGLSTLADGLKQQPAKELVIRQKLSARLAEDVKNDRNDASGPSAAEDLADQQQTIGDLMTTAAINNPLQAAEQYRAALDYWSSNQGKADVINRLCGNIVDAYLAARRWDDAATFAAGIVKKYGKDATLRVTSQTMAREFVVAVRNLEESNDPGAYADAMQLLDAVQKMDPPLPSDYTDQLASMRSDIEAKHAASSKPSQ